MSRASVYIEGGKIMDRGLDPACHYVPSNPRVPPGVMYKKKFNILKAVAFVNILPSRMSIATMHLTKESNCPLPIYML